MSDGHKQRNAGNASAEQGEVILDGPDGVAVSLTPDAAEQTGQRLIDAAAAARDQVPADARQED